MALNNLLQSKKIIESIDTLKLTESKRNQYFTKKIILYNDLANLYNQIKEYQKAIDYYDKIYKRVIKVNKVNAGIILSNKGDVLLNMGQYDKALKISKQAKQLKLEGKAHLASLATSDLNIGKILLKKGDYTSSLKYLNLAFYEYRQSKRLMGIKDALITRADLFYETQDYQKAISDATKALDISIKQQLIKGIQHSSNILAKSYEALGNHQKALFYFKKYTKAKDAIFNEKNIKKIVELETQYQYEKEKEIRDIKLATERKQNKNKILILSSGLGIVLIFLGILYYQYRLRQKTNRLLQHNNKLLQEALNTNKILVKETHHRVKNNLQIISSLLNLQANFLKDHHTKSLLKDSQNRIKSMSLIHQKLYKEDSLTGIDTQTYFTDLIENLMYSYGIDQSKVKVNLQIEKMILDVDTAIPLGLLVNEMVTNAFKHGLDPDQGQFDFVFRKENNNLHIKIMDNGKGINDLQNIEQTNSYGTKLIAALQKKLKAEIKYISQKGLQIDIIINQFHQL